MWAVYSNPKPPAAVPYYLNMSYYSCFTISRLHYLPNTGFRGPFYSRGVVGNTDGGYTPYFSQNDTKIQAYFTCSSAGTSLFPAGSFVLDVEDISVASFYHTGYSYYRNTVSPYNYYTPNGNATFVEVVAFDTTHNPNNKTWYEQLGGTWSYTLWSNQHADATNNMIQIPGNTYTRKRIRMPKFNFPAITGAWTGGIAFRFFNDALQMDPPTGISQWKIYGLYWRQASDSTDHLIWTP